MILLFLCALLSNSFAGPLSSTSLGVIRGIYSRYPQVVNIVQIKGSGACTATLVGPRALLTAAHCGSDGEEFTFLLEGERYRARLVRSPLYENVDRHHDYALAVVDRAITGIKPWEIGGSVVRGDRLYFLGYGCSDLSARTGAGPQRMGFINVSRAITDWFDSDQTLGAAVCPGDSGGPAFAQEDGRFQVRGVVSLYHVAGGGAFADVTQEIAQRFLQGAAARLGLEICGINQDCGTRERSLCVESARSAGWSAMGAAGLCGTAPTTAPLECYALARARGWSADQGVELCRDATQPIAPVTCMEEAHSKGRTDAAALCRGAVVATGPVSCWKQGIEKGWSDEILDPLCRKAPSRAPVDCVETATLQTHWSPEFARFACARAVSAQEPIDCVRTLLEQDSGWYEAARRCSGTGLPEGI